MLNFDNSLCRVTDADEPNDDNSKRQPAKLDLVDIGTMTVDKDLCNSSHSLLGLYHHKLTIDNLHLSLVRATLSTAVNSNALFDSFSTCNFPLLAESEADKPEPIGESHNRGGEMSEAENNVDWDCERVAAWEDK